MDEEATRWRRCAVEILWYFGYPRERTRLFTHGELQSVLCFACGTVLGGLSKAGALRETLDLLRQPAGDGVSSGGEGVTGDGGDRAGGAGLSSQKVDDVGEHDEPDGDPKL